MPKDEPDAIALAPLLAGQRLIGVVKNYNGSTGFGFVTCAETQQLFKRDVFLQRQEVISSGAKVGSTVSFTVELNKDGKPQARHVEVLSPEDDELKMPGQGAVAKEGPQAVFHEMMSSVDDFVENAVSDSQRYEGYIKSFNKEHGFGFVASVDTHRIFGRDVFLHQSNLSGCWVGDAITFRLDIDPAKGTPRAKDIVRAPPGTLERIQAGGHDTMDIIVAAIGIAAIQMSIMSLNATGSTNSVSSTAVVSDVLAIPGAPSIPSIPLVGVPCPTSIPNAPSLGLAGAPGAVAAVSGIPAAMPWALPGMSVAVPGIPTTMDAITCGSLPGQGFTIPAASGTSTMSFGHNFLSMPSLSNVSMPSPQSLPVVSAPGVQATAAPGVLSVSSNLCQVPGMFAADLPGMSTSPPISALNIPGVLGASFGANGTSLPISNGSSLHLQSMPVLAAMSGAPPAHSDVQAKLDALSLPNGVVQNGTRNEPLHGMGSNGVSGTFSANTVASAATVDMLGAIGVAGSAIGMGGMDLQAVAKMMNAMGMKSVKVPSLQKIQTYLENQERQDAAVKMQIEQLQQLAQKGDEKPERRAAASGMPQAPPPEFDIKQRFVGIINKFNRARGFGFIKCDETYAAYGDDVFLHNEQRDGFEVGDVVSFALEIRGTQARARDLRAATGKHDKGYDKECDPSSLDRWGAMKNRTRFDRVNLHEDREKKDRDRSPGQDHEKCRSRSRSRSRDRRKR